MPPLFLDANTYTHTHTLHTLRPVHASSGPTVHWPPPPPRGNGVKRRSGHAAFLVFPSNKSNVIVQDESFTSIIQ